MIEKIRSFNIRKAGVISLIIGIIGIMVQILMLTHVIPYTWINGGRLPSYQAAVQNSYPSIILILLNIPITLIASRIIPIKLNKFWTIVLIIWLWASIPLDIIGIAEQLLGTLFEKTCMSIITIIGFMMDFRMAAEKRFKHR